MQASKKSTATCPQQGAKEVFETCYIRQSDHEQNARYNDKGQDKKILLKEGDLVSEDWCHLKGHG